jgi:hypothetical protein
MKAYWGTGGIAPLILWPRHYIEVSSQLHALAALPPGKEPLMPLDAVVKRKIPSPRRESNPRTPIVQPVSQRYTDWAIVVS